MSVVTLTSLCERYWGISHHFPFGWMRAACREKIIKPVRGTRGRIHHVNIILACRFWGGGSVKIYMIRLHLACFTLVCCLSHSCPNAAVGCWKMLGKPLRSQRWPRGSCRAATTNNLRIAHGCYFSLCNICMNMPYQQVDLKLVRTRRIRWANCENCLVKDHNFSHLVTRMPSLHMCKLHVATGSCSSVCAIVDHLVTL